MADNQPPLSSDWDSNAPIPDLPQDALTQYAQNYQDPTTQVLQGIGQAGLSMLTGLGSQALGTAYGIGKDILSGNIGTPKAQAEQTASDISQKYTYQPTNPVAQNILDAFNTVAQSTGPLPETWVPSQYRNLAPSDLQAIAGKVSQVKNDVQNIPTDFVNAQNGVKRVNSDGSTPLGVKLQSAADAVGDYMAKRQAQGKSALPMPAGTESIAPQTNLYAVRAKNQGQLVQPIVTGDVPASSLAPAVAGIDYLSKINGLHEINDPMAMAKKYVRTYFDPSHTGAYDELLDYDGTLMNAVKSYGIKALTTPHTDNVEFSTPLVAGFAQHVMQNIRDMYPNAVDGTEAGDKSAYNMFTFMNSPTAIEKQLHQWLIQYPDSEIGKQALETARSAPMQQDRVSPNHMAQLPSFMDFMQRAQAAKDWINGPLATAIQRTLGTADDPFLQLAHQGMTAFPLSEMGTVPSLDTLMSQKAALEEAQAKDPKTNPLMYSFDHITDAMEDKQKSINDTQLQLQNLKRQQQELRYQAALIDATRDPVQVLPELGALTNPIANLSQQLLRQQRDLYNLQTARGYMNAADQAITLKRASDLFGNMSGNMQSLFPDYKKDIAKNAPLFTLSASDMHDTGMTDFATRFTHDVLNGTVPVDALRNLSVAKYAKNVLEPLAADHFKNYLSELQQSEKWNTQAASNLASIPPSDELPNTKMQMVTPYDHPTDIATKLSAITYWLDHCVGSGGGDDVTLHPLTGEKRKHVPAFNPDGTVHTNAGGAESGYMRRIQNNEYTVLRLLDKHTGQDVGTIGFDLRNAETEDEPDVLGMDYVSGYDNGPIDRKYSDDVAEALNRIHAEQPVRSNDRLYANTGVIDLQRINSAKYPIDVVRGVRDLPPHIKAQLPRFMSEQALKDNIAENSGQPVTSSTNVSDNHALNSIAEVPIALQGIASNFYDRLISEGIDPKTYDGQQQLASRFRDEAQDYHLFAHTADEQIDTRNRFTDIARTFMGIADDIESKLSQEQIHTPPTVAQPQHTAPIEIRAFVNGLPRAYQAYVRDVYNNAREEGIQLNTPEGQEQFIRMLDNASEEHHVHADDLDEEDNSDEAEHHRSVAKALRRASINLESQLPTPAPAHTENPLLEAIHQAPAYAQSGIMRLFNTAVAEDIDPATRTGQEEFANMLHAYGTSHLLEADDLYDDDFPDENQQQIDLGQAYIHLAEQIRNTLHNAQHRVIEHEPRQPAQERFTMAQLDQLIQANPDIAQSQQHTQERPEQQHSATENFTNDLIDNLPSQDNAQQLRTFIANAINNLVHHPDSIEGQQSLIYRLERYAGMLYTEVLHANDRNTEQAFLQHTEEVHSIATALRNRMREQQRNERNNNPPPEIEGHKDGGSISLAKKKAYIRYHKHG